MIDQSALFRALGITNPPPGADPNAIVEKVLGYGLLQQRVIRRLLERDAIETLGTFRQIELEALRRYAGAEAVKPKWTIHWAVLTPDSGVSQLQIVAKSFPEGATNYDEIRYFGPRTIEDARQIRFRGEAVPGDVLYLYSQYLGSTAALWAAEAARTQQKNEAEAAQKKQSNIAAGQTIVMTEGYKEIGR
jgi:hypothetical protein